MNMKSCFNLLILLIGGCLLLGSCKSKQQAVFLPSEPVVIHKTDTVWERTAERVRIDTVTVTVEIPAQSAVQTVRDSVSHIETDYAESTAWINPDGSLGHSIRNKEKTVEENALVPVKETTTDRGEKSVEQVPVYIKEPVPVAVEKELTLWQRFRLGAFWWLFGISVCSLLWIFRGAIKKILKKLL